LTTSSNAIGHETLIKNGYAVSVWIFRSCKTSVTYASTQLAPSRQQLCGQQALSR
jgi:hypothetical protein